MQFFFSRFSTVEKLDDSNSSVQDAACRALAEIARNGPLPLADGNQQLTVMEPSPLESTDGPTKLDVTCILNILILSDHTTLQVSLRWSLQMGQPNWMSHVFSSQYTDIE